MGKTALILEGGAMRATYTAGVLDALLKENFFPDKIYAVSAGSCHACSFLSHQFERNLQIITKYARDSRYISFRNLLFHGGVFGFKFIFDDLPNRLIPFDYDTCEKYVDRLTMVATNCITGKAEYLTADNVLKMFEYCQASSSMPLLSRIKMIDGTPFLDGSISDSIPIKKSIEDGNEKHIVVLTRDKNYRKEESTTSTKLMRLIYKKYPAIAETHSKRHLNYNETLDFIEQLEDEGKIIVIRPSQPINVGHIERDVEVLTNIYKMGFEDTLAKINSF